MMGKQKIIKRIPNILTMTNMLFGLAVVIFLIRTDRAGRELIAAGMIIFGGVIDFFDGYIARKFDAVTVMGKQLDSFADLVTFGIAPVCLVHYLSIGNQSISVAISSVILLMAGAYRLARYNINDFSNHFMGLPITIAGILLAVYCAIYPMWASYGHPAICVAATTVFKLILSVMMVSRVRVKRIGARTEMK